MTDILINWQPDHLENKVVKLIPLSESDFESLYKVASDPLIWEQHPENNRYKREVFQRFFNEAIRGKSAFLINEVATNTIIGSTRYYNYDLKNSSIAIGYTFLAKKYWGGHFNKESKILLLDYAFQNVDKVYFHIGAGNIRSQLATTRIGAIKVNEFTSEQNGKTTLKYEYLIEKKNWTNK